MEKFSLTESNESLHTKPLEDIKDLLEELYESPSMSEENRMSYGEIYDVPDFVLQHPTDFFTELLSRVKENRDQEPEKVKSFLEKVGQYLFSFSPGPIDELPFKDVLLFLSKINRVEEMRALIGQQYVATFVYQMLPYIKKESIISAIEELSAGEREDTIQQFETCFSLTLIDDLPQNHAQGEKIIEVMRHFRHSACPFMRMVSEVALERIGDEMQNPSLGMVTTLNNKAGGRVHSRLKIPDVRDKIRTDIPFEYIVTPVSKDALIALDHAGMARYGAVRDNTSSLLEKEETGLRTLELLENIKDQQVDQIQVKGLINILGELYRVHESEKTVAEFYAEIFNIDVESMQAVIETGDDIYPYVADQWEGVKSRILQKVEHHKKRIEEELKPEEIHFQSFSDFSQKQEFTLFAQLEESDQILLIQGIRPEMRKKLEEEIGVDLSNVSFRSQMHMLRFLSQEKSGTYELLKVVLEKHADHKTNIIEAFSGCAEYIGFGEDFLKLCQNSNSEQLQLFLETYLSIVNATADMYDMVNFDAEQGLLNQGEQVEYQKNLLVRARRIFSKWQEYIEDTKSQSQGNFMRELMQDERETAIFTATFKTLRAGNAMRTFELMKGVELEVKTGASLDEEEKERMNHIYQNNYKNAPGELKDTLQRNFESRFGHESVEFYLLKRDNKVIAFLTLEETQKETSYHELFQSEKTFLYFGSFNVDPSYQNATVAEVLLHEVIDTASREHVLLADCPASEPIGATYIENGFFASRVYDFKGKPSLEIARDDSRSFETKKRSQEDLRTWYLFLDIKNSVENASELIDVKVSQADKQSELSFEYLKDGYVLTRYFRAHDVWYAFFEKSSTV